MENANYTFIDSVTLIMKAPDLKFAKLNITDLEGNPADRLMIGQSSYLTFDIENQGGSKSMEVRNTLNLLAPFLHVDEEVITILAIDAGAIGQVTFFATADDDAVDGIINYSLLSESGFHTECEEKHINLGYITEDFEDETLSEDMQWSLGSGSKKWFIIEDTPALGGHCLRSPSITDKASSSLNIGFNADMPDTFSFYHKTSTEENDKLILNLNGKEIETWSGIGEWERSEYALKEGLNVIRFTFKKDESGSDGEDAVMIDRLCFPPFAKMVLFAGDDAEVCSNATFVPEGYIYNHTDLEWSTNGDGAFDDITSEHPTYTFGEADKEVGNVELTLTGTSALNGNQQSSIVTLNLIPTFDPSHTPAMPSGTTEIDLRLVSQSEYEGEEVGEAVYTWSIEPSTAGSIIGEGHRAHVEWDSDYRGQASISYRYENPCGSTTTAEALTVEVFNSTGIGEQGNPSVEVYPNPATDMVYVKTNMEGKASLRVIDLSGRVVLERGMQDTECKITTTELGGQGIYTLQVIQNDIVTSVRVVIMP
jgi:hypothetical protein